MYGQDEFKKFSRSMEASTTIQNKFNFIIKGFLTLQIATASPLLLILQTFNEK